MAHLGNEYLLIYSRLLRHSLTAASLPWIAITIAVTSLTLDRMKAGLYTLIAWFIINSVHRLHPIHLWLPKSLLDALDPQGIPWHALFVTLIVTAGGIILAVKKFEEHDY